jgi:hypothetical protein
LLGSACANIFGQLKGFLGMLGENIQIRDFEGSFDFEKIAGEDFLSSNDFRTEKI